MLPKQCQMALKEWAITVEAMAQGDQILLLRKGGIHENGKDFRVIHREFLFYPTYLHQKEDLLQPSHQPALRKMLEQQHNDEKITFSYWAKLKKCWKSPTKKRWTTWNLITYGLQPTPSPSSTGSPCSHCRYFCCESTNWRSLLRSPTSRNMAVALLGSKYYLRSS